MSDDEDETGAGVELLEALPDGGGSAIDGKRRGKCGRVGDGRLGLGGDGVADKGRGQCEAESGCGEGTAGFGGGFGGCFIQAHRRGSSLASKTNCGLRGDA